MTEGHLQGICAIEFAAQVTAIHASLNAPASTINTNKPAPMVIAALKSVKLPLKPLNEYLNPLSIYCRLGAANQEGAIYQFRINHLHSTIASGRITLVTMKKEP